MIVQSCIEPVVTALYTIGLVPVKGEHIAQAIANRGLVLDHEDLDAALLRHSRSLGTLPCGFTVNRT